MTLTDTQDWAMVLQSISWPVLFGSRRGLLTPVQAQGSRQRVHSERDECKKKQQIIIGNEMELDHNVTVLRLLLNVSLHAVVTLQSNLYCNVIDCLHPLLFLSFVRSHFPPPLSCHSTPLSSYVAPS